MRNEQAASYAAQAYGYLTGRPRRLHRRDRPGCRARPRRARQCAAELLADDPDRRRLGDLSRRHGRLPGRAPGADRLALLIRSDAACVPDVTASSNAAAPAITHPECFIGGLPEHRKGCC
jgi:hypothetical protein